MPEIAGGADEFDARGEFVVVGGFDADDAAILMLLGTAVDEPESLPCGYGSGENHQSAVGADALHLGGFAEELSFAFKSEDFNGNDQPEALASALRARRARGSLGIHTNRGYWSDGFAAMVQRLEIDGTEVWKIGN